MLVTSVYLQAAVGLNPLNMAILATAAHWQEAFQLPTLIGGDFNVKPQTLNNSTLFMRSGLLIFAPADSTYRSTKSRSTIDYFLMSKCLADDVAACRAIADFPLKPHVPVELALSAQAPTTIPVLAMAPKLPTVTPYGPKQEPHDWSDLEATMQEGHQYYSTHLTSQAERQQVLDQCYAKYVRAFEAQICSATDTPRRPRSTRGQPPIVKHVPVVDKAKRHMKSWHALDKPLFWLLRWTQDVLRLLAVPDDESTAQHLNEELHECPQEFRAVPALIGLHRRAAVLIKALEDDTASGTLNAAANQAAFTDLHNSIQEAVEDERRHLGRSSAQAWRSWVKEAGLENKGWAHRWTKIQEPWRPCAASSLYTGSPRATLEDEGARLTEIWKCSRTPHAVYETPEDQGRPLPELSPQDLLRATRTQRLKNSHLGS